MHGLPVIESRPMPAPLACAQLLNVRAAIAIRKDRLMSTDHGAEAPASVAYPRTCRCGQLAMGHHDTCPACRAEERAPQGSQQSLFIPTAAPIPGQQTF
jgi:hypothetical protein